MTRPGRSGFTKWNTETINMEEALIKRVLPHSLEAEQSVIGSMLMDREAVIAASEIITEAIFTSSSTELCLMPW